MVPARKAAEERVEQLRGFYTHLFVYLVINGMLLAINLITSPDTLWFYWVSIFWGVGLVFHAFDTFAKHRFFGEEWKERKVREYMEKHPNPGEDDSADEAESGGRERKSA